MSKNRNTFICNKTNSIFSASFRYHLLHVSDSEFIARIEHGIASSLHLSVLDGA